MACNSLSITKYPLEKNGTLNEHHSLTRASSAKSLCNESRKMVRSQSDHHLCYSANRIRIRTSAAKTKLKNSRSFEMFKIQLPNSIILNSLRSLLFDLETEKNMNTSERAGETEDTYANTDTKDTNGGMILDGMERETDKRANWVERLVEIRTRWREKQKDERVDDDRDSNQVYGEEGDWGGCEVEYDDEEDEYEMKIDRESFTNLLGRVTWSDTKNFARLAFLCNMAYSIPEIKANDLKRSYSLDFVTSSLEKKVEAAALKQKLDENSIGAPLSSTSNEKDTLSLEEKKLNRNAAYEIAASAASYVHSCAKDFLSPRLRIKQDDQNNDNNDKSQNTVEGGECFSPKVHKSEVAAHMAASTMTVVVAAGEREKRRTAKELQSLHSSPCEWFICDDPSTYTRCFVIQGSDSLASWQANLFFEPTKFEDTEALVHRGIYEAAKGIYEQFMPQITQHLNKYGERAKLQFTGHSLGGSLALLVSLMLLTRKIVKPSALHPIITFGSPFVFCGGEKAIDELGVSEDSIQCVMMHRDIVPRAFACNYPNHVAQILKRLSGSFRTHPCLNKKKLLYSPMGKIFILQPDPKTSPTHPFLPPETALYALRSNETTSPRFMKNALGAFLNTPHPLETLSDPKAYTSEGTIKRDHDSTNYLKAMNAFVRQENAKVIGKKSSRERSMVWPLLTSQSPHTWGHDIDIEGVRLVNNEVMTSV